jgi:MFS family permease
VAAYLTFARVSTFGGFVVAVALLGTGGSLNNMASRSVLATTREGGSVVNFSLYYVMINVSALIGPLIGTVLLADDHMRLSFLLAAALHLLFAAGSAVALRRPPVPADADADATPDGVSGTAGAGGPPAAVAPVGAAAMLGVLRDRHLVRYVLLTTGGWALITQFNVALPLALAHQGEPASRAGLLVALNALVVIVAVWLLGTRVERRTTDGRIAVLALSGLVLGAGWLWPAAGGVWSLVVAVVVASIGESLFCAVVDVLVAGMAPDGRVGLYLGYSSLAWAVGGVIGSLVGGCLAWAARHDALAAYWVLLAGPGFVMAVGTWRSRAFLREGVDGRTRLDDTVPAAA